MSHPRFRLRGKIAARKRVTQSGTADRRAPLQFGAFEDAVEMVRWMRFCKVAKVVYPVLVGPEGLPLAADQENGIHIARVALNYEDTEGPLPARR